MICLGDGPTEGGHYKTRQKARKGKKKKEESSDTELDKAMKYLYVQLVVQGRHKRPEGRQRQGQK